MMKVYGGSVGSSHFGVPFDEEEVLSMRVHLQKKIIKHISFVRRIYWSTLYARDVWSEIHVQASSNCASARRTGRPSISEPPPFSDCQSSVYTITMHDYMSI